MGVGDALRNAVGGLAGGGDEIVVDGRGLGQQAVDRRFSRMLKSRLGFGDIAAERFVDRHADSFERAAQGLRPRFRVIDGARRRAGEIPLEGVGMLGQRVDLLLRFCLKSADGRGRRGLELLARRRDIAVQRGVDRDADRVERIPEGLCARLGHANRVGGGGDKTLLEGVGVLGQRVDLLLRFGLEGFDGRGGSRLKLRLGRGDILAEGLVDGGAGLVERGAQRSGLRLGLQDGGAGSEREMLLEGFGVLGQRVDLLLRLGLEGFDGGECGLLELRLGRGDILAERLVDGGANLVERGAQRRGLRLGLQDGLAGGEREMLLEGVGVLGQRVDLLLCFRVEGLDG